MEGIDATHFSHVRSTQHDDGDFTSYFHEARMNHFLSHPQGINIHSALREQIPVNGQHQSLCNTHYGMLQVETPQGFLYDTMSIPARTQRIDLSSKRLSGKSPKPSQSPPSAKRQKIRNQLGGNEKTHVSLMPSRQNAIHGFQGHEPFPSALNSTDDLVSVTGSRVSECCSSCSEGLPCAEPDCEKQKDAVVPCSKQSCDVPVCPDPCLPEATGDQKAPWQQQTVHASERISSWDSTSWSPEAARVFSPKSLSEKIDPALLSAAQSIPIASRSQSSDPATPSITHDMKTPFSPGLNIAVSQFIDNPPQTSFSNGDIVSGTGTMFDTKTWAANPFPDLSFESGTLNCAWGECTVPFASPEEWSAHLHQAHVDPQMTFNCPLQSGCQPNISCHPLDHLQSAHGFDVNYSSFSCPAPACAPENQIFCNPAMLHNHFDQAHATPATGSLFCQWNDCNTIFTDQRDLLYHLTDDHRLIYPAKEVSIEHGSSRAEMAQYPRAIQDEELSEDEGRSPCQWNSGSGVCGIIFENPKELQDHITEQHLKSLNKTTGYYCQWDNCNRQKLGIKAGFSQRGKLVRHMQTHTILKEEVCDFPGCGRQFSAKQALLQHKRIHTGEKPFKCSYCDRAFAQQSACTMHERTHTGLKPLQCEHCGKRFSESSNLSKHRRMHQAEKEKKSYKCDFAGCGKAFVRFASLKNHKKEAHGAMEQNPTRASASSETDTEENFISSPAPRIKDPRDIC